MTAQPYPVSTAVQPGLNATQGPRDHAWQVSASKEVSYEVIVGEGLLDPTNPMLARAGTRSETGKIRRLVVVDATVQALYGPRIAAYLAGQQVEHEFCVIDAHESVKNMETVFEIVAAMDDFGVSRRREPVIAIGGGVLTDLVGLATSLYRRSTPYIRVPTTLICMVDAGIGAKTGVNFHQNKNRLGTYHPSAVTLIDPEFLVTLDPQHLRNGLAEVLKIAVVKDAPMFELLDTYGARLVDERMQVAGSADQGEAAGEVMRRAIHAMLEELQPNLWEHQLQRVVDFGHSFSPAIEMAALPELLHGEAVCVDMALSSIIAHHRGLIDEAVLSRIIGVMVGLGLPLWHPVCTPELVDQALADTVNHRDGRQILPLPDAIGHARFVDDVTRTELDAALAVLRDINKRTIPVTVGFSRREV